MNPATPSRLRTSAARLATALTALVGHHHFLPACFAAFVALRLALIFVLPVNPHSDAEWYVLTGSGLAAGEGYHEGPSPTAFWPIGYPLFLGGVFALAGPHVLAAKLANLVLSCGIFVVTLRLGRRIFACETTARLGVLLLTCYPNQIAYTGLILAELLGTFILLAGCDVFLARPGWRRALPAGLLFGFGALIKAQFLLMPAILLGVVFWRCWENPRGLRQAAATLLVFFLAMAAVITPLTLRNYRVFHHLVLISNNGGLTFLAGNNAEADGAYVTGKSFDVLPPITVTNQVERDHRAYALAKQWIADHPGQFVRLLPRKLWQLWAPDGESEWSFQYGYPGYRAHIMAFRVARLINQAYYFALMLTAFCGIALLWRGKRPLWPLGIGVAAVLSLISLVYFGASRFHFPVMPFMALYAGWAITRLGQRGGAGWVSASM